MSFVTFSVYQDTTQTTTTQSTKRPPEDDVDDETNNKRKKLEFGLSDEQNKKSIGDENLSRKELLEIPDEETFMQTYAYIRFIKPRPDRVDIFHKKCDIGGLRPYDAYRESMMATSSSHSNLEDADAKVCVPVCQFVYVCICMYVIIWLCMIYLCFHRPTKKLLCRLMLIYDL